MENKTDTTDTTDLKEMAQTMHENFENMVERQNTTLTTDDIGVNATEMVSENLKEELKEENENLKSTTTIVRKKKKNKKEVPLKKVVEFAKTFSSTGAAFILATLGVITQTFHNGFLAFELSSFDDFWLRLFQAILAAFFVSGALLYFTVRAANGGGKIVKQLVWSFFAFEVFCNVYYWANKYIIIPWGTEDVVWSSMIIAIPFSIMIPFSIKAYAGELHFTNDEDEDDDYEEIEVPIESISDERLNEVVELVKNDLVSQNDKIEEYRDFVVGEMSDFNDRVEKNEKNIKTVHELNEKTIKDGDSFKLNLNTKGKDGESITKTLNATIHK